LISSFFHKLAAVYFVLQAKYSIEQTSDPIGKGVKKRNNDRFWSRVKICLIDPHESTSSMGSCKIRSLLKKERLLSLSRHQIRSLIAKKIKKRLARMPNPRQPPCWGAIVLARF
jgi:hypothetical protein